MTLLNFSLFLSPSLIFYLQYFFFFTDNNSLQLLLFPSSRSALLSNQHVLSNTDILRWSPSKAVNFSKATWKR